MPPAHRTAPLAPHPLVLPPLAAPRLPGPPFAQRYLTPLAPGEEAAVEYRFRADPALGAAPPRELHLALHLLYGAGGVYHTVTFHNATVEFSEGAALVDADLLWLVLTLLALGAGGGECGGGGGGGGGRAWGAMGCAPGGARLLARAHASTAGAA